MPGFELLDYARGDHPTADQRDKIIRTVHDILQDYNGKRPGHSTFKYSRAGYLDVSCFDTGQLNTDGYSYILVVDGEKTEKTLKLKNEIRQAIKTTVAKILKVPEEKFAVRYRVYDSSFG